MEKTSGQELVGSDSEYDVVEGITTWELVNPSDVEDDSDVDFAFSSSSSSEEEEEEEEEMDAAVDDRDGNERVGDVIGSKEECSGPITDRPQKDSEISVQFLSCPFDHEDEEVHHQAAADVTVLGYADFFPPLQDNADVTVLEEEVSGLYPNGYADYHPTLQDYDDPRYYNPGPYTNGSACYLYDDDGYYDEYDLDDELMPRSLKGKFGKERIKKLGKRGGFARMKSSKKLPHYYNRPGCVYGKHGLGVQHSYV